MSDAVLNHTYWLSVPVSLSFRREAALGLIIPTGYEQLHLLARAWHRLPALLFVAGEVCVRLGAGREWEGRSLFPLCAGACVDVSTLFSPII